MNNIVSSKSKKRNSQKIFPKVRTIPGFYRKVFSSLNFGRKFKKKDGTTMVSPALTNDGLVEQYNAFGFGDFWRVKEWEEHCAGKVTLYFWGNEYHKSEYVALKFDIDIQKKLKKGSRQGAKDCAEFLTKKFGKIWWETSEGGEGMNGFALFKRHYLTTAQIVDELKKLQEWCKHHCKKFDIENIEIKGMPPRIRWFGKKKANGKSVPQMDDVIAGQWARIPRTPTLNDLQNVAVIERVPTIIKMEEEELCSNNFSTAKISESDLAKIGSVTWDFATDANIKKLENFAQEKFPEMKVGRKLITSHDFAVALAILHYCYLDPNDNHGLPVDRIKELWLILQNNGVAKRSFDCKSWARIRNCLTEAGLIKWVDNTYYFRTDGKKGKAMQFCLTPKFAEILTYLMEEEELCSNKFSTANFEEFDEIFGTEVTLYPKFEFPAIIEYEPPVAQDNLAWAI